MEMRDKFLLNLRPQISSVKIHPNTCTVECFQNNVLRPVILLQKNLLLAVFRNYLEKFKNVFYDLSAEKKTEYIDNAFQKDFKFRNALKGMIIGHFTLEEYDFFVEHSVDLNRRIIDLIKETLKDNLQLLEFRFAG